MLKILLVFCFMSVSVFAKSTVFVGIAGGTGSGKTTLAEKIHQSLPGSILISQDSYYKDISYLTFEERNKRNFDHPDSLEFSLLAQHLLDLKNGQTVDQPIYNFHIHGREKEVKKIEPADVILVEGILLFSDPEIRDLFDIKIFVDTDDDVRVLRRIQRDMEERSRDFTSVKEQYLSTVKPMHDAFVSPSKKYADIVVLEGGHNQMAIDLILAKLRDNK